LKQGERRQKICEDEVAARFLPERFAGISASARMQRVRGSGSSSHSRPAHASLN
jgi:hypothetical protein